MGRPQKLEHEKAKWNDRLICSICDEEYTRARKANHFKTRKHKLYEEVKKNIEKMIIKKELQNKSK